MMNYNDELEMYAVEIKGIIFVKEEPSDNYEKEMQVIADNYWGNIDFIVEFMLSDLQEIYKDIDAETVKANLGRPTIDFDNGTVDYLEQSLDNEHIFRFEVMDDKFNELHFFSIDG